MQKFDLAQALAGKPVKLVGGKKAFIFADISEIAPEDNFPLIGGYVEAFQNDASPSDTVFQLFKTVRWNKQGQPAEMNYLGDIAGMWTEKSDK